MTATGDQVALPILGGHRGYAEIKSVEARVADTYDISKASGRGGVGERPGRYKICRVWDAHIATTGVLGIYTGQIRLVQVYNSLRL